VPFVLVGSPVCVAGDRTIVDVDNCMCSASSAPSSHTVLTEKDIMFPHVSFIPVQKPPDHATFSISACECGDETV
jgi:hypothetical protein